jgi:type IV pilus assembly protein PilV
MNRPAAAQGFTLLEVLVALAIVAIGMLGSLALVIEGLRTSRDALLRTDATMLAADLGERIRTNRAAAAAYALDEGTTLDAPAITCAASGECSASDVAALDLYQWQRQVCASLPDALTSVTVAASDVIASSTFTIAIRWTQANESTMSSYVLTVQA